MLDKLTFEEVSGWGKLPEGYSYMDVCTVAVDSSDRVYALTRGDARVLIYESDGTFIASWGEDVLSPFPHGLTIGPDNYIYLADMGDHTVRKYTLDGQVLMTIGTPGVYSDTGSGPGQLVEGIIRGGPPFNKPTKVAIGPNGDLYVTDGYGNARVHRFSAEGELIQSWGEPGTGPGQFHLPHDLCISDEGRIFVTDRENDRIQLFNLEGEFLEQWSDLQRPCGICMDNQELIFVTELPWPAGFSSYRHGLITEDKPARISVLDFNGTALARWTAGEQSGMGNIFAPHGISVDSCGDVYLAEVVFSFAAMSGLDAQDHPALQKFARKTT